MRYSINECLETKKTRLAEDRRRYKARVLFANRVRVGKIKRKPCVVCLVEPAEGHHTNYANPNEVVWLCTKHHRLLHRVIYLLKIERSREMSKEHKIQTGLRISESMNDEIERLTSNFEISKNALMTIALRIGLNSLKDINNLPLEVE